MTAQHTETRIPLASQSSSTENQEAVQAIKTVQKGTPLHRVKHRSLGHSFIVKLSEDKERIFYRSRVAWKCFPDKLKTILVNEILEVRTGWNTDNFHRAATKEKFLVEARENQCFSVIFRHKILFHKSLDLVAANESDQKTWVKALNHLVALQRSRTLHFNEEQWLIQHFRSADVNGSGSLTFPELWGLLNKLNLEISETYGRKLFEAVLGPSECDNIIHIASNCSTSTIAAQKEKKLPRSDINKTQSKFGETALDKEEFLKFFRELTQREELENIMTEYSSGNADFLFAEDLLNFLQAEQQMPGVTLEKCKELIKRFESDEKNKDAGLLSPNGFRKLMLSNWGSILNPAHSAVSQDMHQPLPSYFIRSSHNTYLVSGQLRGDASVEGYIIALQKGARLLELDVWDGSDGEPIITHGHTLVVPITFRDAVQAINKYAFLTSPYPVIIGIENHCSVEQQRIMADIFLKILGERLYKKRFDPANDKHLPSPADLKEKFIIRGKRIPPQFESPDGIGEEIVLTEEEDDDDDDEENDAREGDVADGQVVSCGEKTARKMGKRKGKLPLAKELSDLLVLGSAKMHSFERGILEHPMDAISSLSEYKLSQSVNCEHQDIVRYTAKRLLKAYPKGLRTDSSNMNPLGFWHAGIQMVTMNMQTAGLEMDLDEGLFRLNGFSGYVLKPERLREVNLNLDEVGTEEDELVMEIKIISGQYLPKPGPATDEDVIDPYVTIQVFGLPCDSVKHKTRVLHNNGFNPKWDENFTFRFKVPELALLRFCVKDYDSTSQNDFIGQFTIPVLSVRPGYSHIHLETGYRHTVDPSATLFVRTSLQRQ